VSRRFRLGFFRWARGLQHRTILANIRAAAQKIFAGNADAEADLGSVGCQLAVAGSVPATNIGLNDSVSKAFRRAARNTGLRPVRQADILSAFEFRGNGVQLRWAHRPGGLCSVPAESRLEVAAARVT